MAPVAPDAAAGTALPDGARDAAALHTPVLLTRCLDLLAPAIVDAPTAHPVLIDCTLGMGGHTEGALRRFPTLTVVGIDRDPQALELASARLAAFGERLRTVHATYDAVADVAAEFSPYGDGTVDGVLADLGVSSLQLDAAERGFSYSRPAPLDMRMDQSGATSARTAADILAEADAAELIWILRTWGEERFAPRIAAAIVRRREAGDPVRDTADLADLVRQAVPAAARRAGGHPAKRTFQALRVAVNAELDVLARMLPAALDCLRVGGRIVVESYQSLEDRLVKQAIAAGTSVRAPEGLPFVPDDAAPFLRALTHGAEQADDDERSANSRSASVRLRAAERLRPAAQASARAAVTGPDLGSRQPGHRASSGRDDARRHAAGTRGRAQREHRGSRPDARRGGGRR